MSIDPSELTVIGKITSVYGVNGWVKVHAYTDPIDNFFAYGHCLIDRAGSWTPITFVEGKRHGKGLIARIEGVDDRDVAAAFTRCEIAVPVSSLPELGHDDYYWHQLIGLKVIVTSAEGESILLGRVSQMLETGANDVLVVSRCQGSIDKRERLIPYLLGQAVKQVDLDSGVIRVDWDPEF